MSHSTFEPPSRLRPGDTVAVAAPSGPVNPDRLARSLPLLEARYKVRVGEGIYARDGYLAGSDQRRADELNALFADPDVRAIFIARGGYGAMRILDSLDADALRSDPIPLVGFSDATALLGWAAARAGVAAIHGPVAAQLAELPPSDVAWLFELLENPNPTPLLFSKLAVRDGGTAPGRPIEGTLLGGNLSLIAHMHASSSWPVVEDPILFLEDVGERPYAIDRYLSRLGLAGAFASVRAAIVGQLTRCEETSATDHPPAADVVAERLATYVIPAVHGAPFGHGDTNTALPFGGRAAIDLDSGDVTLLRGAVR